MYFIYILGLLIILISLLLEPILAALHRRQQHPGYAYLEWVSSETLQLQRMAFQGVNSGSAKWTGHTSMIPTTSSLQEMMPNLLLQPPPDDSTGEKHADGPLASSLASSGAAVAKSLETTVTNSSAEEGEKASASKIEHSHVDQGMTGVAPR